MPISHSVRKTLSKYEKNWSNLFVKTLRISTFELFPILISREKLKKITLMLFVKSPLVIFSPFILSEGGGGGGGGGAMGGGAALVVTGGATVVAGAGGGGGEGGKCSTGTRALKLLSGLGGGGGSSS